MNIASSGLDVPYLTTPENIVEAMVALAGIHDGEEVYDPACGDGRLVISAVQHHRVHGVGTDIDPERIRESRANAVRARVSDRVEFYEKDMFDVDFREANVVLIYLLQSINLKLRSKLLSELWPGSRIVS